MKASDCLLSPCVAYRVYKLKDELRRRERVWLV